MAGDIYTDGQYAAKHPDFHQQDSAWKARQILGLLSANSVSPASVCEIGCGAGGILGELQRGLPPAARLCGYEISPQAYALAAPRANEALTFHNQDLLGTSVEPFDLMLCIDVIEHVENPWTFLRQLRPKATRHMFHIPLDMSAQMVLRGTPINYVRDRVGHIHYFMKDTALATLTDCGFRILDWRYTAAGVEITKSLSARLAAPLRRLAMKLAPDSTARILGGYSILVLAE